MGTRTVALARGTPVAKSRSMRVSAALLHEVIANEGELRTGPISSTGVLRLALDLREAREREIISAPVATTKQNDSWARATGRECRKRAAARWGHGWMLLSVDQREAFIALEVIRVLVAQDESHAHPQVKTLQAVARIATET